MIDTWDDPETTIRHTAYWDSFDSEDDHSRSCVCGRCEDRHEGAFAPGAKHAPQCCCPRCILEVEDI